MNEEETGEPIEEPPTSRRRPAGPARRRADGLRLAEDEPGGHGWVFVHPRCARARKDDMEEVEAMLAAGETEIARDELVWLLSECPDFLEAHLKLALIALEEGDVRLARGHFGRVHELGIKAIEAAGSPAPVACGPPANAAFWEATKGLVHCLVETGRGRLAREVAARVTILDPADPLAIVRLAGRATPGGPSGAGRRQRRKRRDR
jgi:hypothetical protein